MFEEEALITIKKDDLLDRVRGMADGGYRLVQIGCTPLEEFQLDYSFDLDGKFVDLRVMLPREKAHEKAVLPSLTGIYLCAFPYENELHDLFGITVTDLAVDYGGNFYRTASRPPMPPPAAVTDDKKPPLQNTEQKKTDETTKDTKDPEK
ncbi:MAG: NADH-quinone oxidoreductase subunit C [PVC group bacterium]